MRSIVRTLVVLAVAAALVGVVFYNVDVRGVVDQILHARPAWLLFSFATMLINLSLRAWRWQYLLEPIGRPSFANAFRATAVGFAANTILPARAGEVIRPYFLSRQEKVSATGAFATIILERLLDMVTVLALLAVYVFLLRSPSTDAREADFQALTWAAGTATAAAVAGMVVLFALAGSPTRLAAALERLEHILPSRLAGLLARVAEKFATGLGIVRRPGRLLVALALSVPLWLSIDLGIWAVCEAFRLEIPFGGSFLLVSLLMVGVAVPTPGGVGGFHAMFKVGATTFFGAPDAAAVGAAIVAHAITQVPALVLGLSFAAQEGLNLTGMRKLAEQSRPEGTASL